MLWVLGGWGLYLSSAANHSRGSLRKFPIHLYSPSLPAGTAQGQAACEQSCKHW